MTVNLNPEVYTEFRRLILKITSKIFLKIFFKGTYIFHIVSKNHQVGCSGNATAQRIVMGKDEAYDIGETSY